MALIVEIGYTKYNLDEGGLEVIRSLREVDEVYANGEYRYVVKPDRVVKKIRIIDYDDLIYTDAQKEELASAKLKDAENSLEYNRQRCAELQTKTKELEAKLKAYEELCPSNHKKEEEA